MADDYTLKDRITDLGASITEQFKNIARQLELIEQKLDAKASLGQLAELEARLIRTLDTHASQILELQKQSWGVAAVSRAQKFWFSLAFGGGLTAIATLVWLAVGGHQ